MKCYYEELEIERDASESEIKTAYRKLALKWHPDKNLECLDAAKERFQLIQQAYEVLSDPKERAWYDSHRDQILRGKNSDFEDDCLNLFEYFTVSCFKEYGDDKNGFYAVYEEVFKKISAEDSKFMDSKEDFLNIPKFGNSKSSYEEVVGPFYAYWSAYCTKCTYTWLYPYDIREIKDRRILRDLEKEMKKVVQKAKKERNEEVRNLVSFVRKRDKRVQAFKRVLEERSAFNREKQERNRMEQKRRRQQELEEMKSNSMGAQVINYDYEEQLKQLQLEYSSDDDFFEDDKTDEFVDEGNGAHNDSFYCVACNKEFKTEKSFTNHEISRKHRDNIEMLKIEMRNEESFFLQENIKSDLQEEKQTTQFYDANDDQALAKIQSKTKKKREAKYIKQSNTLDLIANTVESTEEGTDEIHISNKIEKDDEEWETKSKKLLKKNKNRTSKTKSSLLEHPSQTVNLAVLREEDNLILKSEATLVCATCKANFESKNKLFSHLKLLNHAVFVPNAKNGSGVNKKLGKSKKKN